MIKEQGKVVKQDESYIWVETAIKSTCSACSAKHNCGTSTVAQAFSNRSVINRVQNQLNAKVGDWVEIGISESSLLHGSFYIYIMPLLLAIVFALVTQFWLSQFIGVSELGVIIATFLGGAIGFKFAKTRLESNKAKSLEPQLLAVLPEVIVQSAKID